MATKENIDTSDEIITVKCCVCIKKNIARDAEKYCVECQDYYCIPCTDMHKMFPAMSGHQILDKADFSSHGLHPTDLPSFPTERCSTHNAKLLDMFCGNHDEVVCASCVALHHRACHDIRSVPENIENLYRQSTFGETKTQLNVMKKTMKDIKKSKEQLIKELRKYKNEATDSVKKFRREMEAVLDKLEKESTKAIEARCDRTEKEMRNQIKEAEKFNTDLVKYSKKLDKYAGNKAQEFVCVKQAEKTIGKTKEAEKSLRQKQNVKLGFLPNAKIKNYLEQLKTLGQVSITRTKQKLKTTVYSVRTKNEINIKLANDRLNFHIYGSCFLSDGSLLLTDYCHRKLKQVDISTATVIDHLDLGAGPYAVCQTSDDEAAVSLENKTIQFVSLGARMATSRQLKLNHYCYGLAYKDGKLYISDYGNTVYIHNMTGTMLHKITTDRFGNAILGSSRHICVSTDRDRVYVADQQTGLIMLDTKGNYISTFTDPDLGIPCGVCTDRKGNILLCGISSNVIQIIEDSMKKIGTLRNMTFYHSACFDPQQNKFVLTNSSNTVTVYELE